MALRYSLDWVFYYTCYWVWLGVGVIMGLNTLKLASILQKRTPTTKVLHAHSGKILMSSSFTQWHYISMALHARIKRLGGAHLL